MYYEELEDFFDEFEDPDPDMTLETLGAEIADVNFTHAITLLDKQVLEAFAAALERLTPQEIIKRLEE